MDNFEKDTCTYVVKNNRKDLSQYVSLVLDTVGYSHEAISERINQMDKKSKAKELSTKTILKDETIQKIFVGSKREGTGFCHDTDLDILQIYNSVVCVEDISQVTELNERTILSLDKASAPAGYTFLTLPNNCMKNYSNSFCSSFEHAVTSRNGKDYVSSDLFMKNNDDVFYGNDGIISRYTCYLQRKGPSIPKTIKSSYVEKIIFNIDQSPLQMDFVRAFPCKCHSFVDRWCERRRFNKWPSQKAIAHVRCLPVYVVPVGKKNSKNEDLQWRMSPTMAEIYLTKSFNNTQTKVFVLLKLISKHILKPVCDEISSYILKNVMFWICEAYPKKKKFQKKHLLSRLVNALNFLKHSVQSGHLECYMIPERNLLDGKLSDTEREILVLKIDQVLSEGQQILCKLFSKTLKNTEVYEAVLAPFHIGYLVQKIDMSEHKKLTSQKLAENQVYCHKIRTLKERIHLIGYDLLPLIYRYGWNPCFQDGFCRKHHRPCKHCCLENEVPSIEARLTKDIHMMRSNRRGIAQCNDLSNTSNVCQHHVNSTRFVSLYAILLCNIYLNMCVLQKKATIFTIILHYAIIAILYISTVNQFWIKRYINLNLNYDSHYPCVPFALYDLCAFLSKLSLLLLIVLTVDLSTYILRYPVIFRDIAQTTLDYLKPASITTGGCLASFETIFIFQHSLRILKNLWYK